MNPLGSLLLCTYIAMIHMYSERNVSTYSDHLWPWAANTSGFSIEGVEGGGLFTEVEINCTSTIGTRPNGLYREVVPGY